MQGSSYELNYITQLQADPYETVRCSIQPSCIPGAGEGLFAKVDIPAGQIIRYYSDMLELFNIFQTLHDDSYNS